MFFLNAMSFLVVAVACLGIRHERRELAAGTVLHSLSIGWTAITADRSIMRLAATAWFGAFVVSSFIGQVAPMATLILHAGSSGATLMMFALGLGQTLGLLSAPRLGERFGYRQCAGVAMCVAAVLLVVYSQSPNLVSALVLIALWGMAGAVGIEGPSNIVLHSVDPSTRAGVLAIYLAAWNVLYALGNIAAGLASDAFGVRPAHAFAGVIFLAAAVPYLLSVVHSPKIVKISV